MLSPPDGWEGALAEIQNSEELEAWLRRQKRDVSVAVAARAALRTLPIVASDALRYGRGSDVFGGTALPALRATSAAWAAAKYPSHKTELRSAASAATFSAIPRSAARAADAAAKTVAARAAFPRRPAAAFATPILAAAAAARAANAAAAALADAADIAAADAFWSAVSDDMARVEGGTAASIVPGLPLWPGGQPVKLRLMWTEVKRLLESAGDDWDVWTDWYEDRLAGRARSENHELAYVLIENELWDQGPAAVNAEIKRRIEVPEPIGPPPIDAIPEQVPRAINYWINPEGLIDVVPDPPVLEPESDALQKELYDEARHKAQALVELGPNQLGDLTGPAGGFQDSLPAKIEDLSIIRSWSRGNTLRSRLKAHDLSMDNMEPDPARLLPVVAETLRDLVQTWNVFIAGDAKGRKLDELRPGPQEVEAGRKIIAAAAPIVEGLEGSQKIATPSAVETVTEQERAGVNAPEGIDGAQAVSLSEKSIKNFVSRLLRRALEFVRNELGVLGKERGKIYAGGVLAVPPIVYAKWPEVISFVARYADELKEFVTAAWHNPTLVEIIDWIARSLIG